MNFPEIDLMKAFMPIICFLFLSGCNILSPDSNPEISGDAGI
jgi:hypothetical protein